MPFFELFKGHPFPGAYAKFALPPGANDWQPKAWGTAGFSGDFVDDLYDESAHFITDGVQNGDVLYVMAGRPPVCFAAVVSLVMSQTYLKISTGIPAHTDSIHYKVGMKAPHDLQSLANIVLARGLYAVTIHWSLVWTQAPFADFAHDETGDIYVCHNMGERRLQELQKKEYHDETNNEIPNPWLSLNPEPEQ